MSIRYVFEEKELIRAISEDMKRTLDAVSEEMYEDLQNQIMSDVYNADYFPNLMYYGGTYQDEMYGFYEPTFDFLNAWRILKDVQVKTGFASGVKKFFTGKTDAEVSVSIEYEPSQIGRTAHKSKVGGVDVSKNLADILNLAYMGYQPGVTSGLMVGSMNDITGEDTRRHMSKYRRPYWENFKNKMINGGGIDRMIKEKTSLRLE